MQTMDGCTGYVSILSTNFLILQLPNLSICFQGMNTDGFTAAHRANGQFLELDFGLSYRVSYLLLAPRGGQWPYRTRLDYFDPDSNDWKDYLAEMAGTSSSETYVRFRILKPIYTTKIRVVLSKFHSHPSMKVAGVIS